MMKILLEHVTDANDYSRPDASSCLSLAIEVSNLTMIRTLIDHGAGPLCRNNDPLEGPVFVESLRYALHETLCNQEVLECLLTRAPYSLMSDWSELWTGNSARFAQS